MSPVVVRENVTPLLDRISAKLARALEPAQGPLTDAIRDFFARRFESRGAYGGTPWAPTATETIFRRLREGIAGDAPLFRTGTLWASLTQSSATGLTVGGDASSRSFGYSVLDPDGMGLHVGSWDPVLNLTERGTRNAPARPVLPDEIPAAEINSWAEILARGMLG